jgi:hypothetical protein
MIATGSQNIFYVNSYVDKLFRKQKRIGYNSSQWVSLCGWTMSVWWWWKRTTAVGGASMVWCSGYGGVKIETRWSGGESDQSWDDLFIAVMDESRTVRGGWPAAVVWIQYFGFSSIWEMTGWSVARRWSGGSELIFTLWKGNMTRRDALCCRLDERWHWRGESEKTTSVGLTRILLG